MFKLIQAALLLLALLSTQTPAATTVRYQHTDILGSVVAETDAAANIISRSHYEPFGKRSAGDKAGISYTGHLQDEDLNLIYMQQRYYDPVIGRFYSNDPVDTVAHLYGTNGTYGFNRYAYANNNPYKFTDPDGRSSYNPQGMAATLQPLSTAQKIAGVRMVISASPAGRGVQIAKVVVGAVLNEAANSGDNNSSAPEVPGKLVGDQSDSRAGPNKSGTRHTSGPLTPENGGTGDYEQDLQTLTGGTRPAGEGDSAPPGSSIGENGIFGRPTNSSGGASIDIPAKGDKPHETLHYEKK